MMRLPLIAFTLALGVLIPSGLSVAHAQETPAPAPAEAAVSAEITILHGTNDKTGIDPKIGPMPELSKPPFSAYDSYKLLDRVKLKLSKGQQATTKLPNEGVLAVSLKDVLVAKKKAEAQRYVVGASVQKPGGNTFLPLLEVNAKAGETFFVAGQNHKGGVLVIGIKIMP